ncbi:tetratricopeptide repeat protein 15 [Thecamonas trahens ATCC 50062]|uniref:Tetratricopeptide repeat protein 15 n=1 Tax=Thecamonas trahens ATCC 50062 TaxID=461836 RepID=A0A0L0DUI7_THETB|nr:tetratricopeptide repeat protein 15 [Thecamonas trahens ATCC 50062]KNC55999.1 tetratricopeptide repeat protein 15 [Thecamonas trahens ATCC 50062]|eukprot:XP_013761045.1 tetratricopeptide repeat protein 15 [Thecamonas trahens ATCC 50062]
MSSDGGGGGKESMRQRLAARLRSPKNKEKGKSKARGRSGTGGDQDGGGGGSDGRRVRVRTRSKEAARLSFPPRASTADSSEFILSERSTEASESHGRYAAGAGAPGRRDLPPTSLADLPLAPPITALPLMSELSRQLGIQHVSAARTKRTSMASVAPERASVKILAEAGAWGDVVVLTQLLLMDENAKLKPHEMVELRTARAIALVKLRMFTIADSEVAPLLAAPDSLFRYSSYPDEYTDGETGSFLPFVVRLIAVQLAFHLAETSVAAAAHCSLLEYVRSKRERLEASAGSSAESAAASGHRELPLDLVLLAPPGDMLHLLLDNVAPCEASLELWEEREVLVIVSLISIYVARDEHLLAIALYKDQLYPLRSEDPGVLAGLGRLYLTVGHVAAAGCVFAKAEELLDAAGTPADSVPITHINRGYVAVAQGQYAAGALCYQRALDLYVEVEKSHDSGATPWSECAKAAAANNRALCWLYAGHLDKALKSIENIIKAAPARNMNPTLIANLCSLYELAGRSVRANKMALATLVAEHAPDNFDVSVLRLQDG